MSKHAINWPVVEGDEDKVFDWKYKEKIVELSSDEDRAVNRAIGDHLLAINAADGAYSLVGDVIWAWNQMSLATRRRVLDGARRQVGEKSISQAEADEAYAAANTPAAMFARIQQETELGISDSGAVVDLAERTRDGQRAEAEARSLAARNAERQSAAEAAIAQRELDEAARLAADAAVTPKIFGGVQ